MATAAQVIAERLRDAGCRYAFGIPGGEVLDLLEALADVGIEFHLTKHENAAGFVAEGVYQRTGAPGVLIATLGPGVANTANVVLNALQDRVPMIVLTGCIDPAQAVTYTHQIFDHRALLSPISKGSFTVVPGTVGALVDKAMAIATDDPPGPVHLDVPVGVSTCEEPIGERSHRARPARAAPADGPELEQAQQWLANAERPVMIAGAGVLWHEAAATVAAFVRDFRVPLVTTYKAKGILDESDPLALGGAGLSPVADKLLLRLIGSSDLILLSGYDPIEMRDGWCQPWDSGKRVLEFSAAPNTHYVHQASLSFIGDVGAGLLRLRDGVRARSAWSDEELEGCRQSLREAYRPDESWGPAAVVDTVRRRLPKHGIATVDSGAHRILLSQLWSCSEPRTLLQSTGLCTMGCALPLAIGAKLAEPSRPVVCFVGDAGLEMVLGELAIARALELPVTVIVFVDGSLALIELKQRSLGLRNQGVGFRMTDFAAVAEAIGGRGYTVRSRLDLEASLNAALLDQKRGLASFSLIACYLDHPAYDGRI